MRLSHSRIDVFKKCKKWFYYQYIKNVPATSDDRYARRGNVVHDMAEWMINENPHMMMLKPKFEALWKEYKLDKDFDSKKDESYLMALNFYHDKPDVDIPEMKIYKPDPHFVCYIDGVNSKDHVLYDWKTSTYQASKAQDQYKDQLGRYAALYKLHTGILPKRCEVWYLKKRGTTVVYEFTDEEVQAYLDEINEINEYIENHKNDPSKWEWCVNEGKSFDFFHPYKDLYYNEQNVLPFKLIHNGSKLLIKGPMTSLLNKGLDKTLSYELPQAHYIKKATKGRWDGVVHLYDDRKQTTDIGFQDKVIKVLNDYGSHKGVPVRIEFESQLTYPKPFGNMPDKFLNGKSLRYYQEKAVDVFIRKQYGIIEGGCSFGKTLTSAEVIRRLDCKTLFIINRKELVLQTKAEYEELLGVECGIIGMGETDTTKQITVCTYQSLAKHITQYKDFLASIDLAIFDECHIAAIDSIYKVHKYLKNTSFRLGMTGSPFRDDGQEMKMFGVCGPIVYKKQTDDLIAEGYLTPVECIFLKQEFDGWSNETYADSYRMNIAENEKRNAKIIQLVQEEYKDQKILILTKLIDHGKHLHSLIDNSAFIYGGTKDDVRKKDFEKFSNGEIRVLIGSASIFSTGINLPLLDCIINAAGNKGDVQTVQSIGRVLRKADGKDIAYYIDFFDKGISYHEKASKARMNILKDFGHNITIQ